MYTQTPKPFHSLRPVLAPTSCYGNLHGLNKPPLTINHTRPRQCHSVPQLKHHIPHTCTSGTTPGLPASSFLPPAPCFPGSPAKRNEKRKKSNKSDNRGLTSADRNNKATLLLTIPRCTAKSYTYDLSPRTSMTLQSAGKRPRPFRPGHRCQPSMVQRRRARRHCALCVSRSHAQGHNPKVQTSPLSSMDSDLEAFSHNPADVSFAALPGQTAANTNYPNELFLSY